MIFKRWAELPVGGYFILVNDHDPVPLYYQFAALFPNAFTWEYVVAGPDEFQVKITRLIETPQPPQISAPGRPAAATTPTGCGSTLDVRGLEPPEPLVRILTAVESLPVGSTLHALTDRKPLHLFPELESRKVTFRSEERQDGSWITTLIRT
jgi:uncharacterized protein (DUF2249 family)